MFGLGQMGKHGVNMDMRPALAQQLIGQGLTTEPVQHWAQGLGRLAQTLLGAKFQKELMGEQSQRKSNMAKAIEELMTEKVGEDHNDTLQLGQQWGNSPVVMKTEDVPSEAIVHRPPGRSTMAQAGAYTALNMPDSDERIPRDIMGMGKLGKHIMAMHESIPGGMDPSILMSLGLMKDNRSYAEQLADKQYGRARADKLADMETGFNYQKQLKSAPGWVQPTKPKPGVDTPYSNSVLEQLKQLRAAGKSDTTVNNLMAKPYEKERAGMLVGEHKAAREEAKSARKQNMLLGVQRKIPAETGWGAQTKAWAYKVLDGMGFAGEEQKAYANNADAFQSVTMSFLLDKLAAQKGPQTEGDAQRALNALATLGNMRDANMFIIDLSEAVNNSVIERTRFMNRYDAKHGNLYGYQEAWESSPEARKSLFDYPSMKRWAGSASGEPRQQSIKPPPPGFTIMGD